MTNLPAIPELSSTLPVMLDDCFAVVAWARQCDDLDLVAGVYFKMTAIAEYLGRQNHARSAQAALRRIEMRIGELLGPAGMGRPPKTEISRRLEPYRVATATRNSDDEGNGMTLTSEHLTRNGQGNTPVMYFTKEIITPDIAQRWLGHNYARQRNVSPDRIRQYAADMVAGRWMRTGDTMKRDVDGKVIDGQHRLRAIIEAGVSIEVDVAWNVQTEAYLVIDQGKKRGFHDYVRGLQIPNASVVSAAISMVAGYRVSRRLVSLTTVSSESSISTLSKVLEEEPGIVDFAAVAKAINSKMHFAPAPFCAALYVADVSGGGDVGAFADQVLTGVDLDERSPAHALRESFYARLATPTDRRRTSTFYTNGIIRSWNAFARGDRISVIRGSVEGKPVLFHDPLGQIDRRWPLAQRRSISTQDLSEVQP